MQHFCTFTEVIRKEIRLTIRDYGVMDYVELTGLSRTTASLELRELCQDPTSGIRGMGQKAGKVYIKRQ